MRLIGEVDALFIDVDTPNEMTARRSFRASRPSKALTRMRSWTECQRSHLRIVGTACGFNGYDERDGRGVHLRPVAQRSPRSAAVPPYEQCSAKLREQRKAYRADVILMLAGGSV